MKYKLGFTALTTLFLLSFILPINFSYAQDKFNYNFKESVISDNQCKHDSLSQINSECIKHSEWVVAEMSLEGRLHRISVENQCSSMVRVAYSDFKNDTKVWDTKGFYEIQPKKTVQIFSTRNATYYLHAHNSVNMQVITGGDALVQVPGSQGEFSFKKIVNKDYDNYDVLPWVTHIVSC